MPSRPEQALIELAKEAHAKLSAGTKIGGRYYRLKPKEVWDPDLEHVLSFCAEDSQKFFPSIAKFQPAQAEDLQKAIRDNSSKYEQYFLKYVKNYYWGKRPLPCPTVNTQTDEVLGMVLQKSCTDLASKDIPRALDHHRKLMVAENAVGQLLERYIYDKMRIKGWIWCAGNIIRFVDFYVPSRKPKRLILQVKNQANSENSASSSVRAGTETVKWFRRNSKTGATKWISPDGSKGLPDNDGSLNEEGFRAFVKNYSWASPGEAAEPDIETDDQ